MLPVLDGGFGSEASRRAAYSQVGGNSRQSDGSSIRAWHGGTGSTRPHCSAHIGTALRSQASPALSGGQSHRPDRRSQLPPLASHPGAQDKMGGPGRCANSASDGASLGKGRMAISGSARPSRAPSRASCDARADASGRTGLGWASAVTGADLTRARCGDARSNRQNRRPNKKQGTMVLAPKRGILNFKMMCVQKRLQYNIVVERHGTTNKTKPHATLPMALSLLYGSHRR